MDEVNARIQQQQSVGSYSNEESSKYSSAASLVGKRICLIGAAAQDPATVEAAGSFGLPVVTSETGQEFLRDDAWSTVFVMDNFECEMYNVLYKSRHSLLGPPALQQLAQKKEPLPDNTRPLFNLAMLGVVVCFTGFRNKDDLTRLVPLVHHMGGSIRKDMTAKVTHLIANITSGDKYQYATTFRVPVMNMQWVHSSWEKRHDISFSATLDTFVAEHKLKPFHGARVCFVGFPEEEETHMTEVLLANGGAVTKLDDATCTHIVLERGETLTVESSSAPLSPKQTLSTPSTTPSLRSSPSTPFVKIAVSPEFDTLYERSHDDQLSSTMFDTTESNTRKRKLQSCESWRAKSKRAKDATYSEKSCKKVSDFFKTPVGFLSNRRRTIGAFNKSINDSVSSTSGIFNVSTTETKSNDSFVKRVRKSLFNRTFSSTKVKKGKKKRDLNGTRLSFGDDTDSNETINSTFYPDLPAPETDAWVHRREADGSTRPSFVHASVVDESTVNDRPEGASRAHVVKAEWFWTSVQKEICLDEKEYLFDNYIEQVLSPAARRDSHTATPSSASRRKRKRLHETLQSLSQPSPGLHKRRSSVSDAGLLSVSGSFLDCTASPDKGFLEGPEQVVVETPRKGLTARHQVFLELMQTESNYVNILHTIMNMFKKHLEEMPEEEALLNNTELKIIFGNLPPISETHTKMLEDLKQMAKYWSEDCSVGSVIVRYWKDLLKAYPPFINFFEEMKEMLIQCDASKPRFHAFLKACQTRPECGRQGLQDLMIRPVQRLGSISLLLSDILKNTPKTNPDYAALEEALAKLREVMTHINEDKRKTEGQRVLFDIFNDIDNCPPDIVSSHRSFIAKSEVIQLSSSEGLSSKGNALVLFLFSDQLEVCKKRSKALTLKSPNTVGVNGLHQKTVKPYKHVKLMPLNTIKRVINIIETEDCQRVFSIVFRNNEDLKDHLYSFIMTEEEVDKMMFLKTLTRQMANNTCTPDPDKFLAHLDAQALEIDTSDVSNGTLSKAFKFANRTRLKVGRAFSFNKTPSKLKRAMSSMMSPFGSSTNLTPASQLANMRLASYNNINELGNSTNSNETQPVAPMSVQPMRKMKASSLGVNALKRL